MHESGAVGAQRDLLQNFSEDASLCHGSVLGPVPGRSRCATGKADIAPRPLRVGILQAWPPGPHMPLGQPVTICVDARGSPKSARKVA